MSAVGASRQRCSPHNLVVLILKVQRADGEPPQCQCAGGHHHTDAATLYGSRKVLERHLLHCAQQLVASCPIVLTSSFFLLQQIVALAVSYFVAVGAMDLTTHAGNINDLTSDLTSTARLAVAAPVAVLDALVVLWVFTALSKTLAQLQARRATAKLEIYRFASFAIFGRTYLLPMLTQVHNVGSWNPSAKKHHHRTVLVAMQDLGSYSVITASCANRTPP